MTKRRAPRRANYPHRYVGQILEDGVEAKIAGSDSLRTESAVARWLGYERSRLNGWIWGYAHPRDDNDWENLTRLPGVTRASLRKAELLDKLTALMVDQDAEAQELAITALEIWAADDRREEIADVLDAVARLGARQDRARR